MRKSARLAAWKKYARARLEKAVGEDPQSSTTYERWWATALAASERMDSDDASKIFYQLAIALRVVINMPGWPHGIAGSNPTRFPDEDT